MESAAEVVRIESAGEERRPYLRALDVADRWIGRLDAALLVAATAGAGLLAASGCVTRNLLGVGSSWLDLLPRYLTLVIGFVGAGLATQQGTHIALDLASRMLRPSAARWLRFVGDVVAAMVSALLAIATIDFMASEREGGSMILGVLPSWIPALVMLWGFTTASLRFALRAAGIVPAMLLVLPAAIWGLGQLAATAPEATVVLSVIGIVAGAVAGAPLFVLFGAASLVLFWNDGDVLAVVPVEIYRLAEAPALVTLPLFTLVGAVLAKGGAPGRLVGVARACVGWLPGGLLMATVLICAFFTTFTGASGVTILALGLLLRRVITEERYGDDVAVGLITASGSIGLLWPPALPLIIYGIVGKVDIDQMFLAGIVPGVVLVVVLGGAALFLARRQGAPERQRFDAARAARAVRDAAWELLLPAIVLGLWSTGMATVVEAAAVGAVYVVVVALARKDIDARSLLGAMRDSGVLIGAVLVILGVATAFTGWMVMAEIPQAVVDWSRAHIESRWMFLLALNLLLLVVGCLLDIFSAIIVFVPLLAPVAAMFEVDPVHLGIIFLANLEIGYLTPPVGMNLFLASFRFGKQMPEIWRSVLPYMLVLLVALLVITYVPALSTGILAARAPVGPP